MVKLTPNFSLEEMTRSKDAISYNIDNSIKDNIIIEKLRLVCSLILEPVRANFNKPIIINSGYRSPELELLINKDKILLGIKTGKYKNPEHYLSLKSHPKGEAVDFEIPGISNYDIALWISSNLKFDQCILEFYVSGIDSSGWVHASWRSETFNRNEILTINKQGTFRGLIK